MYLEGDPPRRLVFTFTGPQFSPNTNTITVDLASDGDGTLMTFTEEGDGVADEQRQTRAGEEGGSAAGWGWMFVGLDAVLGDIGGA